MILLLVVSMASLLADQRLTHEAGPDGKFLYCLSNAAPWVMDRDVYSKSKLVSMVASNKGYTVGHQRRLKVVEAYYKKQGGDDLFGWGLPQELPLKEKSKALRDYMFSFAVENANYPTYFTEKLTDCFACGTIPVYYGTAGVAQYFNPEGIIFLDEKKPWDNIPWDKLTPEYYESKKDVIQENFEIAQCMRVAEDYMYGNYLCTTMTHLDIKNHNLVMSEIIDVSATTVKMTVVDGKQKIKLP